MTSTDPICPNCKSTDLGMWAEDGVADQADFWECEDCKHGGRVVAGDELELDGYVRT